MRVAAGRAQALEFIERSERKFDSNVGERGRMLSGGERQRLSIARALLKDPPILILDEATSALDAVTEAKVNAALDEVMKGRTSFVIAHRLSTIRNATRILVFDSGRVIESETSMNWSRKAAVLRNSHAPSSWLRKARAPEHATAPDKRRARRSRFKRRQNSAYFVHDLIAQALFWTTSRYRFAPP